MNRVQPVVDDHDTGGFFAAAARGELVVQECRVPVPPTTRHSPSQLPQTRQ